MPSSVRVRVCACVCLFESEPALGVVYEDLVHLCLGEAPPQHLGDDALQDVGVAVAAVLGQAVLGVDVVCHHDVVLIALLHQEPQADHTHTHTHTHAHTHTHT